MLIFVSNLGCLKEPISRQDAIRIRWLLSMCALIVGKASLSKFGPFFMCSFIYSILITH